MKKELIINNPTQIDSALTAIRILIQDNYLESFHYRLDSKRRVAVKYVVAEMDEDKEREILISSEVTTEFVYVLINIHYILRMMDKMKMTVAEVLKYLYSKYSLQALMGLFNENEDFPNIKIRELACNLEINWKMNKNDEDFFQRAFMFGLEEYKNWKYYYKALEAMMSENAESNEQGSDPSGEGEETNDPGEGNVNSNSETDVNDQNGKGEEKETNDQENSQSSDNQDEESSGQGDQIEDSEKESSDEQGESNDKNESDQENTSDEEKESNRDDVNSDDETKEDPYAQAAKTPEQLKLERYLDKTDPINDVIQDSSQPAGMITDDDMNEIEEMLIKNYNNLLECEKKEKRIENIKIEGFQKLLQNLLRKERQVKITQTRKRDSYHRINNRREEKGLILPGKKIVQQGVQKKFAERLDVFIDISGSTYEYISRANVHYIDIMNFIAKEFHSVGSRIIFYNYCFNRIVRPGDLFIPADPNGSTDIMCTVSELEKEEGKLNRIIVFTDGYDSYKTLYDTHKDVQVYKLSPDSENGFRIEKYNRNRDYFFPEYSE